MSDVKNFYQVRQDYVDALDKCIDPETGEFISEEAEASFNEAVERLSDRADVYITKIKMTEARAEELKKHRAYLDVLLNRAGATIDGLKDRLKTLLNGEKYSSNVGEVYFRKSQRVVSVGDPEELAAQYPSLFEPQVKRVLDKNMAKDFILAHGNQKNLFLENRVSTVVKVNYKGDESGHE
jgi:hypothetical protein